MKRLVLALLVLVTGCSSNQHRMYASITNVLEHPIRIKASMGPFAKEIVIMPGQRWDGWIDTRIGKVWKPDIVIQR